MTPFKEFFTQPLRLFTISAASVLLIGGIVVLVGWTIDSKSIVQIHPTFAPMQFNTALSFSLLGAGLLFLIFEKPKFSAYMACTAAAIGGATLFEYLSGFDLGIDNLLHQHDITVKTTHVGRMAPNTAFCFLFSGTSILVFLWRRAFAGAICIPDIMVTIVGCLSFVVLFGYLTDSAATNTWANLTRMAAHTSLGFILFSAATLAALNEKSPQSIREKSRTRPIQAFMASGLAFVALWFSAGADSEGILEQVSNRAANNIHSVLIEKITQNQIIANALLDHYLEIRDGSDQFIKEDFERIYNRLITKSSILVSDELRNREWSVPSNISSRDNGLLLAIQKTQESSSESNSATSGNYLIARSRDDETARITLLLDIQNEFSLIAKSNDVIYFNISNGLNEHNNKGSINSNNAIHTRLFESTENIESISVAIKLGSQQTNDSQKRIEYAVLVLGLLLAYGFMKSVRLSYTVREKAAETLAAFQESKSNEAQLQATIEATPAGILNINENQEIASVNRVSNNIFGFNEEELVGKNISEIIPTYKQWENDKRKGICGKHKDGHEFPIAMRRNRYTIQSGTYTMVSVMDISEAIEREKALYDSQVALENVLEGTMTGYWDRLIQEDTEFLSPSFKQMFGYEEHEMENKPSSWQKIIHPEDLPGLLNVYDQHVSSSGRVPFDNTVRYYHKDGSIVWVICRGKVIEWDENGSPLRMVGSHVNITSLKTAEQNANSYAEELRIQKEDMEQIMYIVSHDLKSPLLTIQGFSDLAYESAGEDPDTIRGLIDRVKKASRHMNQLIGDILEISRIGRVESPAETVDIAELVENLRKIITSESDSRCVWKISEDLPLITANKNQMVQAFQNLMSNALKYGCSETNQTIEVNFERNINEMIFSVRDFGAGIKPEYHEKVFKLFEQLSDSETGTGIGLAIVHKVANENKGRAWVESSPGEGANFRFSLPIEMLITTEEEIHSQKA